ncbi:DUF2721 domain-containing protein [Halomonas denitrificans]|nr:DUF2721 domain-containing protein [Halomonas denitrificans]
MFHEPGALMNAVPSIEAVAAVIQAALTPVFLLVAIGGFLNMLSARLGRIIDRKRAVDAGLGDRPSNAEALRAETDRLRRRVRFVNGSIRLCVASAVLVCLVVVTLFVGELTALEIGVWVAGLFMAAMLLITGGLVCLLLEIGIAARQVAERR